MVVRTASEAERRLFGIRLTAARDRLGISQRELSRRIEVSESAVCQWESGKATPCLVSLVSLCRVLGASSDVLLGV